MSRIWAGIDMRQDPPPLRGHSTPTANACCRGGWPTTSPNCLQLIGDVLALADGRQVTWAIDMTGGEPALLMALLVNHGQELLYIPGRLVNRASDGYRGEGKTDARDAYVIADQARMRRDLRPIRPGDEAAIELQAADRTPRRPGRGPHPRRQPAARHPAEHVPRPGAGPGRDQHRPARAADRLPDPGRDPPGRAPAADRVAGQPQGPQRQDASPKPRSRPPSASTPPSPARRPSRKLVHTLAEEVMALNEKISEIDKLIEGRFREHELAEMISSVPGIGTAARRRVPRRHRRRPGRLRHPGPPGRLRWRRPRTPRLGQGQRQPAPAPRYHRRPPARLLHLRAGQRPLLTPNSRQFYDRKRAEGKRHTQAVLALARRRVNVLWALIRDRRCYQVTPPVTTAA